MDKVKKLIEIHKKTTISSGINKKIDNSTDEDEDKILKKYQNDSYRMTTDLIKFQAASKLASNLLSYVGTDIDNTVKLSIWENDTNLLLKRFELESELVEFGMMFLGFNLYNGKPYPFIAKISSLTVHPITNEPVELSYQISEITLSGKQYALEERWTYDPETKKYHVNRDLERVIAGKGKVPTIPEEYQRDEETDFIYGEVFYNTYTHKSDIQNVIHLMKDKGSFIYYLLEKFEYLSAKVFNKSQISGINKKDMDKKMKKKTFINITSDAGQYQNPVTIFNPTLPNSVIQETIKFYDDQIFMFSLASRPTDSGKQAQTNDLEQSLKNEMANNYIEYKKNVREIQFTNYIKKISEFINVKIEDAFKVSLELSAMQQQQLESKKGDE